MAHHGPQPNPAGPAPQPADAPATPSAPTVYLSRFEVLQPFLPLDCFITGETLTEALRARTDPRAHVQRALGSHQRFADVEAGYSFLFEDFHPSHPKDLALRAIAKLGFIAATAQGDTELYTHPRHGQYFIVKTGGPAALAPPRRRRKRPAPDPTPARVTFLALYGAASPIQLAEGAKGSHALPDGRRVTFVSLVPYPGHAGVIQKLLPHCLHPWPVTHPQLPRWHRTPP